MAQHDFAKGIPVARVEDERFLTGRGRYVADVDFPGQLHAVIVRSPYAHALVETIERSAALRVPGVRGVHVADDLLHDGIGNLPCVASLDDGQELRVPPRFPLARVRLMHVGDPVAVVVAETVEAAADAASLVELQVCELPAVIDSRDALESSATELWPECPGNLSFEFVKGDLSATNAIFASAAHVVEAELTNTRVCAAPLETRAATGLYDAQNGDYRLFSNTQGLHAVARQLADTLGVDLARLHLQAPDVGGGFGLKNFLYPEWPVLLWAARHHGCPIKWVETRAEQFSAAAHGRGMQARATLALDDTGQFLALHADVIAELGGYLSGSGPNVSTKAFPTAMGGIYAIPTMSMRARGAMTNTAPLDAYRGAGKPEANYLIERLIDIAGAQCGFDALDLRRRNLWREFPHRTAWGLTIDGGNMATNLELAVQLIDRAGFPDRRAEAKTRARLRGLGITCFLETSRGPPQEGAAIHFTTGGRIEIIPGTESHGQGHETAFTQIAATALGVPPERIDYLQADTRKVRIGYGHGGARSMHMGGGALMAAIGKVVEKGRAHAARLLQTNLADVQFEHGRFHTRETEGAGQSVGLIELADVLRDSLCDGSPLDSFAMVEDAPFTFPCGTHAAEVEVDADTGTVEILRYVIVDDYGELINPILTAGQVHGGVAQGIGQALGEAAVYDPDSGQLLSGSFMDYFLPRANHLPSFEVRLEGMPTAANVLGVKGSGQAGAIAAPQAIVAAVMHALGHNAGPHLDMPLNSEKIWRALKCSKNE